VAKLLEPDARALAPAAPTPQRDRAPDDLAGGTPAELRAALIALVGAPQVLSRPIDLVRYATDASPYRLFPKAVVLARGVDDVRALFAFAHAHGESITLRAAGTSLSGQAQGDGILVDVRRHWSGVTV
jgi:D-lactate dehydrogenase